MIDYKNIRAGRNCIIWTRVSTKYQEDNGGSIASQKKCCEDYAKANNYTIKAYCGGVHESAKTPGPLIKGMMDKVKRDQSISTILISEFDRFSREAWQAIKMLQEMRQLGIIVIATKIGLETRTKEGMMMAQNTLAMAQWDNQNRTDKFVGGRADCIKDGAWCEKAPFGYYKEGKSRNAWCYLNEDGKLLRKAFKWKLQGLSNADVLEKLKALGMVLDKRKLHKILVNPFYAGKIVHKYNDNVMIDGQIEPAISYADFLKVQDILSGRTGKFVHAKQKPQFPLTKYVLCGSDGTPFTSYTRTKKNKGNGYIHIYYYYKCNKAGCRTNVSASEMHEKYEELLANYDMTEEMLSNFTDMIRELQTEFSAESKEQTSLLKKRLSEIDKDIKNVRLRYAAGKIDEESYSVAIQEYQNRKDVVALELEKWDVNLSNLEKQIPQVIATASNIKSLWHNSDLETKKQIQNLVFPNGIYWDKEIGNYRTSTRNRFFDVMSEFTERYKNKTEGDNSSSVALCG